MSRLRSTWWWLRPWLGPWLAVGCGPQVESPDDSGATTSTSTSASTDDGSTAGPVGTTTAGDGVDSTTGATTSGEIDDAELCLEWCLNAADRGCDPPFSGEGCYTFCLNRIEDAIARGCGDEHREVVACEGQASPPAEIFCEALECEEAYKRDDLCRGFCAHLGGYPGSSGSRTSCEWSGQCYGHDFEVVCPVGDAQGVCSCTVDGRTIAQCEVGISLSQFQCGGEELHVFTNCCREAFEGVLFP